MKRIAHVVCATVIFALCATIAHADKYPDSTSVALFATKPVLTALEGYPAEQINGDISIRCVAEPFVERVIYHKTLKEKPKGFLSIQTGKTVKYLVTEEPIAYSYTPERLTFSLRIANNTTHVLRFSDCLISLNIDNAPVTLDKSIEETLRRTVILPHGTAEFTVEGPKAQGDRVNDTATTILDTAKVIILSLYDVTVEVDEANNPVKKATFDWIYENKPVYLKDWFHKVTTEEKMLPADAQKANDQWYYK